MAATPESKCKKRIRALLDQHQAYYIMPVTGGYGRSGVLDFCGVHRGQGFVIEAKADTPVTMLQQNEMDKVRAAGGYAFVVRLRSDGTEEGFDDLRAFLLGGGT